MTDVCSCCGRPADVSHTHHVNEQRGDNHPDNLSTRDRRCHMEHHDNDRAADAYARNSHLPDPARGSSARPTGGPP